MKHKKYSVDGNMNLELSIEDQNFMFSLYALEQGFIKLKQNLEYNYKNKGIKHSIFVKNIFYIFNNLLELSKRNDIYLEYDIKYFVYIEHGRYKEFTETELFENFLEEVELKGKTAWVLNLPGMITQIELTLEVPKVSRITVFLGEDTKDLYEKVDNIITPASTNFVNFEAVVVHYYKDKFDLRLAQHLVRYKMLLGVIDYFISELSKQNTDVNGTREEKRKEKELKNKKKEKYLDSEIPMLETEDSNIPDEILNNLDKVL